MLSAMGKAFLKIKKYFPQWGKYFQKSKSVFRNRESIFKNQKAFSAMGKAFSKIKKHFPQQGNHFSIKYKTEQIVNEKNTPFQINYTLHTTLSSLHLRRCLT
jgi:hypothetical protein